MTSVLALALLTPFGRAAIDSGAPAAHASRTIGGGSLLVQLRPLVGLPEEAVVAAVIRGPRAAKIRRLTPGMPARLPYSSPEGSLVVLVTEKRSGEANELGEPIAILEQACSDPPSPRLAPPAVRHVAIILCDRYRCDASAICVQSLAPLANGSASHLVISSQDSARWTWASHYPFDAPRWCALKFGRAYASEAEVMLLPDAEVRAILHGRPVQKSVGPTALGARDGVAPFPAHSSRPP